MKSRLFFAAAALIALAASEALAQAGRLDQPYADQLYNATQSGSAYSDAKAWCDSNWSQDPKRYWAGPNDLKGCYITQAFIADINSGACNGHGFPVGANPKYRRNQADADALNSKLQFTMKMAY